MQKTDTQTNGGENLPPPPATAVGVGTDDCKINAAWQNWQPQPSIDLESPTLDRVVVAVLQSQVITQVIYFVYRTNCTLLLVAANTRLNECVLFFQPDRSGTRLLLSTSERFAPHLLNSIRDRSDRSDFVLTKTCDETGQRATPIFSCCFCAANCRMEILWKIMHMQCFCPI